VTVLVIVLVVAVVLVVVTVLLVTVVVVTTTGVPSEMENWELKVASAWTRSASSSIA